MGCDIHSYVETKDNEGRWQMVQTFSHCVWDSQVLSPTEPYQGRDYQLFGWLTGGTVRDAGQHDGLEAPRGVPKDMSSGITSVYENQAEWVHSASYATLAEIREAIGRTPKKVVDSWAGERVKSHVRSAAKRFADGVDFLGHSCGFFGDDCDIRVVFWFDS